MNRRRRRVKFTAPTRKIAYVAVLAFAAVVALVCNGWVPVPDPQNGNGSQPPQPPSGNAIFKFTEVYDANDIFLLETSHLPNVRFGAGGIKFNNKNFLWVDKPTGKTWLVAGWTVFYRTGFIYHHANPAALVQVDNRGFIVVASLTNGLNVPSLAGWQVDGSNVLNRGQKTIFYLKSKPQVGGWFSLDVESGSGCKVHWRLADGSIVDFNLNFGHGEAMVMADVAHWTTSILMGNSLFRHSDGSYMPPTLAVAWSGWHWRQYPGGVTVVTCPAIMMMTMSWAPSYFNDPGTTTWQNPGIMSEIYAVDNFEGFWGYAYKHRVHDTGRTLRYINNLVTLFKRETNVWKVRKYFQYDLTSTVYNYDQKGATTSCGLVTTMPCWGTTAWTGEPHANSVNPQYYAYQNGWQTLSFSTTYYTWVTGYKATRVNWVYDGTPFHVYTFYVGKPTATSEYKHARYYWHFFLNHYFTDWSDTTLRDPVRMGVEEWFSKSNVYQETPPDPVVIPEGFIGQFFRG